MARPVRFYRRCSIRLGGLISAVYFFFLLPHVCVFLLCFFAPRSASLHPPLIDLSFLPPCLFLVPLVFCISRSWSRSSSVAYSFYHLYLALPCPSLPCPACFIVCVCVCPHVLPPYTLRMYVCIPSFPHLVFVVHCILYAKSIEFYCNTTLPAILRDECV